MRTVQVFLLVMSVTITGCGTKTDPSDSTAAPSLEAPSASAPQTSMTTISVAAASDLKFAMDDIISEFQTQHSQIQVKATYGSSGNFFAQLSNKAPFDIYFSADMDYPRKLIEQGQALKDSEFQYAVGQIVVWVRNESPLDLEQLGIKGLLEPEVKKVAIANPKHAPYGRAAEAALKNLGIFDQVSDRLVFGENISQTLQFVESGAAEIGIVARSLALAPAMKEKGRYWTVPAESYPRLEQGGVILSWAKDQPATREFRDYVIGEQGRATLKSYGFLVPGE